jgi:DNA-binding FrmR family transcriptional regulator
MKTRKTAKDDNLDRLSRIEGQVRGVHRMVSDDGSSVDIVTQIQAVRAALLSVSKRILEEDLRQRASSMLTSKGDNDVDKQLEEIMFLASKLGK